MILPAVIAIAAALHTTPTKELWFANDYVPWVLVRGDQRLIRLHGADPKSYIELDRLNHTVRLHGNWTKDEAGARVWEAIDQGFKKYKAKHE